MSDPALISATARIAVALEHISDELRVIRKHLTRDTSVIHDPKHEPRPGEDPGYHKYSIHSPEAAARYGEPSSHEPVKGWPGQGDEAL
jgi:hypothetical protein